MPLQRPRPLVASDGFSSFDSGESSLDDWIKTRALRNEATGGSRTFVTIDSDSGLVAGYYCLSSSALRREEAPGKLSRNAPNPIPMILIGRLAVDVRFQGQGVGSSLLQDALVKAIHAAQIVGSRAVLVHAVSGATVSFYEKFGFALMPEGKHAMYLLLSDAEATIREG